MKNLKFKVKFQKPTFIISSQGWQLHSSLFFQTDQPLLTPSPSVKILISRNWRQVSEEASVQFFSLRESQGTERRDLTPEVFSVTDKEVERTGLHKPTDQGRWQRGAPPSQKEAEQYRWLERHQIPSTLAIKALDFTRRECTKMHFIDQWRRMLILVLLSVHAKH